MSRENILQIESLESLLLLSASSLDCSETLLGSDADDSFEATANISLIDGRDGFDRVNFADEVQSNFEISEQTDGSFLIRNLCTNKVIRLIDVEQVTFADCATTNLVPTNSATSTTEAGSTSAASADGATAASQPAGSVATPTDFPQSSDILSLPPEAFVAETPIAIEDGTQLTRIEQPTEPPAETSEAEVAVETAEDPNGPFTVDTPDAPLPTEAPDGIPPGREPISSAPAGEPNGTLPVEDPDGPSFTESPDAPPSTEGDGLPPIPEPESPESSTSQAVALPPEPENEPLPFVRDSPSEPTFPVASSEESFAAAPTEVAPEVSAPTDFVQRVLDLTNELRRNAGLSPLTLNSDLGTAAQIHAENLATQDFFDHVGRDGSQPWDRAEAAGYDYRAIGENIAAGQVTPEEVVSGWFESDGHRANILNPDFTELGVGYSFLENDTGSVNYNRYWSQLFGTER